MSIISHNNVNVNIVINKNVFVSSNIKTARRIAKAKAKRAERQADEKKPQIQRWQEHKADTQKVAERLIKAGLTKRGRRMSMCGNELIFMHCEDCGHVQIKRAQLCRDRLCPVCNWRLAIKRYISMSQIMSLLLDRYPHYHYSLITLTAANCKPDELKSQMIIMQQSWESLRQQRWARDRLDGWARSIEITYNEKTRELHPHYHVIVMSKCSGTDQDVIDEWLKQCRKKGLKVSYLAQYTDKIIDKHNPGKSLIGAICETYKYMVKSTDMLNMPMGILRSFAEGVAGKRLISFGGLIKQAAKELEIKDLDDSGDEEEDIQVCTHCGSQQLDELILQWSISANQYFAIAANEEFENSTQELLDRVKAKRDGIQYIES